MAHCVRVLFIEDNEDDAFLLQLELERSGYDLCVKRVSSAPDLEATLDNEVWDVVLADYSLPRLDAPRALAIVRDRLPDTPFIIVSGTIGEEAVVKCMRDGANDFFVKGRTALLPHAIERELEAARVRRLRREAEQELRDSEHRLAQLFSSSPVPYSVTRISDSQIVEVNDAYARMTGYSREELIGSTVEELGIWVYAEQRAALVEALKGPLPVRNFEFTARTRSGELGDILLTADIIDFYGEPCVLSMALDVTERKRALDDLRRSELRFRMMTENALDLYALLDDSGRCMYASPAFQRLLHYDPQSLVNSDAALYIPNPEDWFQGDEWRNLSPRRGRLRTAEGDWLWVEGYTYPIQLDDGQYVAVVGRDIGERLQLEEERLEKERLRLELQQQKELGDIKSRFVSMVSHEFRTPLTTIQTSGDLLKHYIDRMSTERRDEHLATISDQVQQLTHLLDEVLIISKADSVGLAFNPVATDVRALVKEVVAAVEHAPGASGRIAASIVGDMQAQLDPKLFRQVLTNLLVNALKYSEPGTPVRLDVQVDGDSLLLEIEDRGIGIPEADLPHLFEAFHRAGNVGKIAGTGLGLAIVKRAVDTHGGSIAVTSQVGLGTSFTIRVPVSHPIAEAVDPPPQEGPQHA